MWKKNVFKLKKNRRRGKLKLNVTREISEEKIVPLNSIETETRSFAGSSLFGPDFQQLLDDIDRELDENNLNVEPTHIQIIDNNKINRFKTLTIFKGVMIIGDFLKIGRMVDNKLDYFISMIPGTKI